MKKPLLASVLVCFTFILWGTSSIFVRFIDVGPHTFVLANAACGWVALLPLFIISKQYREIKSLKILGITIGIGLLQTITGTLYYQAVQLTTITNALLSHYTMPMFVILLSPLLIGEKRRLSTILALPVAFAGLFIILPMQNLSLQNTDVLGIVVAVVSAVFYALSMIGIRRLGGTFSSFTIVMTSFTASIIALTPIVIMQPGEMQAIGNFAVLLIIKGLLTAVVPWMLFVSSLKVLEAQHVSIIGYLEPLTAIALAALIVGELPGVNTFIGGALILGAGIWVIIKGSRRQAELATDQDPF